MANPKTSELKCYVMATGVKKRCRKPSREMINLGNYPLGTSFETVRAKALQAVKDTMKTVNSATIHLDLVEIETIDSIPFETWIMFDKRHTKENLIAGPCGVHGSMFQTCNGDTTECVPF